MVTRDALLEQYSNLTRQLLVIERRKTALEPSISQFKKMTARWRGEQSEKINEFEKLALSEAEIQKRRIEVWKALVNARNIDRG